MSLMTGRYVLSHGVYADRDRLPDGIPTLAEGLRGAGYATGGIVAMVYLDGRYGFNRGFDHYDDQTVPKPTAAASWNDEPAPVVTDLAIRWLGEHRRDRFFLFLHYWDVHYDYIPPAPYDTMFDPDYRGAITGENFMFNRAVRASMAPRDLQHLLALYDGEVRWVDDHIAKIVRFLEEAGLYENTLLIVTADHGDEFFEHGYKGHRRTLYREVAQVPLIIRGPGVRRGAVVDVPVSLVDIMPTVLELAGERAPAGVDGISLVPWLSGSGNSSRSRALYAELTSNWKTHHQVMQHAPDGILFHHFQPPRLEFYAPGDRGQVQNLAEQPAWNGVEKLEELTRWLNSHWAEYQRYGSRPQLSLDKATEERLRALGY
jgi:arylsulfatase A-like enzyme